MKLSKGGRKVTTGGYLSGAIGPAGEEGKAPKLGQFRPYFLQGREEG